MHSSRPTVRHSGQPLLAPHPTRRSPAVKSATSSTSARAPTSRLETNVKSIGITTTTRPTAHASTRVLSDVDRGVTGMRTLAHTRDRQGAALPKEGTEARDGGIATSPLLPSAAEEEFERLTFSQPSQRGGRLTGRLGGVGGELGLAEDDEHVRASARCRVLTPLPDHSQTHRSGQVLSNTEEHKVPETARDDEEAENRAAAAAASRFLAMKLGVPASDMNATLTGGGGGVEDVERLPEALIALQHTFQSSFSRPGSVGEVNLNSTIGRRERAAMLLSAGVTGATTTCGRTDTELRGGAGGGGDASSGSAPTLPQTFGPSSSAGYARPDILLNSTLNSTTGLSAAIDELRSTLRGTLPEALETAHSETPVSESHIVGVAHALHSSAPSASVTPALTQTTGTRSAAGTSGGGARVHFAHVPTTTPVPLIDSATNHSDGPPSTATEGRPSEWPRATGTKPGLDKLVGLPGPSSSGVATTRTMAALGRLYAQSPPTHSSPPKTLSAPPTAPVRPSSSASATVFSTIVAQQAPLASLRYEALTVDALQRRFGPLESLATHLVHQRDVFLQDDLSVFSIRSSAAGSVFREIPGSSVAAASRTAAETRGHSKPHAAALSHTGSPSTVLSGPEGKRTNATPTAHTLMYMEALHTSDSVLRHMAMRQATAEPQAPPMQRGGQQSRTTAEARSAGASGLPLSLGQAGKRLRPRAADPPPPDRDDAEAVAEWKAERRRVRDEQQRRAVREATGAGTNSADILDKAMASNARLLETYVLQRPADEKLRNKVRQWLDRVQWVVQYDRNRDGPATRAGETQHHLVRQPLLAPAAALHVEEDPSTLHEAVMRVMRAEEADVHARNLLERGRLTETGVPYSTPSIRTAAGVDGDPGRGQWSGAGSPPIVARSGVLGPSAFDHERESRRAGVVDSSESGLGGGSGANGNAFASHTLPTRRLASLTSRFNPWGYTQQELCDQEAPVFDAAATETEDAMLSLLYSDGVTDPRIDDAISATGTTAATQPGGGRKSIEGPEDLSVGTRASDSRRMTSNAAAKVTLSGGERELLDFAMQSVFHPSHSHHLRAFTQSRSAAEHVERTERERSSTTATATSVVTFAASAVERAAVSASAEHTAGARVPLFMKTVRPETLVTTGAYESASPAWVRCVNEQLQPQTITATAEAAVDTGCVAQCDGAPSEWLKAASEIFEEESPRPSVLALTSGRDTVALAAVPLCLHYTLPKPRPRSPLMPSTACSSSVAWGVSLDLLDIVVRLPDRVVERLLEVARTLPAQNVSGGAAGTMVSASTDGDRNAHVNTTASTVNDRPHSSSQIFLSTGVVGGVPLRQLDSGLEGTRQRQSSVAASTLPSWCKAAWKKAISEAAAHAEESKTSLLSSPVQGIASPWRQSFNPAPARSPSASSPFPPPWAERSNQHASPRASRSLSVVHNEGTTCASAGNAEPRRSGAAISFTTASRPATAELSGFSLLTNVVVEQSLWRVTQALAAAAASSSHMAALTTPPTETRVLATATHAETAEVAEQQRTPADDTPENDMAKEKGAATPPRPTLTPPPPSFSAPAVGGAASSSAVYAPLNVDRQDQPGGPHWLGPFPVAPSSRAVYPLDMRHLYVIATLAVEETDGQHVPRLQRLRAQYRQLCQVLVRRRHKSVNERGSHSVCVHSREGSIAVDDGTTTAAEVTSHRPDAVVARSQRSPFALGSRAIASTTLSPRPASTTASGNATAFPSLGTSLEEWAAVQRLLALEAEFAVTVSNIYRNEVTVNHFNMHVTSFNRYQAFQRWLWSPIYRSALRLSYHLCLLLAEQGLEYLPESYVRLLHPIASFVGCTGGHREMRANLSEVLMEIVERAKRVRLPLDPITAAAFRDTTTARDTLLDAAATACDGTHKRREAAAPYGSVEHPKRPFTVDEEEAVRLVEAAYATEADEVIRAADVVSCLATEADELSVPLKPVAFATVRFREIDTLTSGMDA